MRFKTTAELKVPTKLVEQIIGQDSAVDIIRKAARQRRHVLLIGTPGTGKSMLGQALAELMPKSKLSDILILPNQKDSNEPLVKTFPAGNGRLIYERAKARASYKSSNQQIFFLILALIAILIPWWIRGSYGDIMAAASLIAGMMFIVALSISMNLGVRKHKTVEPKLLIDNSNADIAPFIEATGAKAGALLGDVRHDPFQSGGLGTPAHMRVEAGMIHRANGGVLFVDEVATLDPKTQQDLLTALQEGAYSITGQSEKSAGAMVRTKPVPCSFVLVAAGNTETVQKMHPALRSRIRGYGYEIYMNDTMEDNPKNQELIARFVAQEVVKDKKIPHFTKAAVEEIIKEARKRAGQKSKLTLMLRDLGGLIRAAGDLAREDNADLVLLKHVVDAKKSARALEQQIADKYIERKKEYEVIRTKGKEIGRVNGLAVLGEGSHLSGIVQPIEVEVTPTTSGEKQRFIATGKLGEIAKEAITNVSAIIKNKFKADLKKYDVYVQFLQTYEGLEGDSASVAVATAIISALKRKAIRQDTAMTGSLSVRGEVLPVGGVTSKIEAAIEAGLKRVLIPAANEQDIVLSKAHRAKIKVIPIKNINDLLKNAF
ncbi:ATP-dependent protease LonB [Candidatus Woesearchaeota archaeon]|jgi:ATP-dependent Lon protease|nr:ATP-dependent protease LonB [Candidatus Woesearchaeota archaeon]MBT4248395.1 ATP-dependent protease LonB [Candidatus Woesearchaeota archaeon]